jgi:hypothetical protein
MADDELSLESFRALKHRFEAAQTAEQADAFLRLGHQAYRCYHALTHGGYILVGNDPRTRRGEEAVAEIRGLWAGDDLRIYLTEFLPDGQIIVCEGGSDW